MNTLLLDPDTWDLLVDASGNIAMAADPYAVAQDVASACRLFLGELWYDTTQGVPYFSRILGKLPPLAFIKGQLIAAAMTVPGVARARVFFTSFSNRELSGQMQITTTSGTTVAIAIGSASLPWYVQAVTPAQAS